MTDDHAEKAPEGEVSFNGRCLLWLASPQISECPLQTKGGSLHSGPSVISQRTGMLRGGVNLVVFLLKAIEN